jgi:sugar-specific transcriptional regulator TrmB
MTISEISKLGLTESESIIYQSVLKLGICTVRQISKECGFHRTNIYDILEQLKEKGLITYFKEGKTTKYKITEPNNWYDFLQEKKEILDNIFPEIQKLYKQSSEELQVEVYKGEEGMKTSWRDMIKTGKAMYGFGVKGQLREKLPVFAKQWMRDAKNKKIEYYGIYTEKNVPGYYTEIRFVSEELSGPVATFIYADKININIWEPTLVAIVIKSKLVSQMYKKHFDLLWKIAKKQS